MQLLKSSVSVTVLLFSGLCLLVGGLEANPIHRVPIAKQKMQFDDKFRQLEGELPTPNDYRNAAGAPGFKYWQQKVDYDMDVKLDPKTKLISGEQTVIYHNRSPDSLDYLWLHIEANSRSPKSAKTLSAAGSFDDNKLSFGGLRSVIANSNFNADYKVLSVTDINGEPIPFTIVETLLRIDPKRPIRPTRQFQFKIAWQYKLHDQRELGGRSGYESFAEKNNEIYQVSVFYPRLAAYSDSEGWHNKAFLGRGEFTLEFGDFRGRISVPKNFVVAATGELQNPRDVLSTTQRQRLEQARSAKKPMFVITPEEAKQNELEPNSNEYVTWDFKADQVRDFAFAASPKFIWDAMGVKSGDLNVLAMSYWPEEASPLWDKYSTQAIAHTIEEYNRYTFDYPYPTAISVNGPVGGMEYPMITFNGPRPEINKETGERTYSRRTKYGLISVIIHEIGHNYFPMIVNSDERQWTWMDEGLNTFLQFVAEQSWEEDYPSRRGEPRNMTTYMASEKQVPIMTNSESVWQFGNNAYAKPATALNILRETILGRDLFDFAFRTYAQRWKFKRPQPADFFRTMEDASGVDLDWFWRGWFYSTDHVDISLDEIVQYKVDSQDQVREKSLARELKNREPESLSKIRNRSLKRRTETFPELKDFYNEYDEFTVTDKDKEGASKKVAELKDYEQKLLKTQENLYQLTFSNKGGLVMPIIMELEFDNGTKDILRLPAEVWRMNPQQVTRTIVTPHLITQVTVDPYWETADVDTYNNHYPRKPYESRLEIFKRKKSRNLMKDMSEVKKPKETEEKVEPSPTISKKKTNDETVQQ